MKTVLTLCAALLLAGCSSEASQFTGSPHGYTGNVDTIWADVWGVPTILQSGEAPLHSQYGADGSMSDMPSTFEADASGNVRATGTSAYLMALAALCTRAPQAGLCGGAAE